MTHRKIVEQYYVDINNLADLLNKLVNSYRLLIGGAGELNGIALAHKKDVKNALKRVNKVGDIIDEVISVIDVSSYNYMDYCRLKAELLESRMQAHYIETEICEELEFENDKK
jgi:hypothetical protein